MIRATRSLLLAVPLVLVPAAVSAYPLDGYEETGIRRVEGSRLATEGLALGGIQPPGALLTTEQVDLRLLDHRDLALPRPDPDFTAEVAEFLGGDAGAYGVAVVDLTDPDQPVYAEHRGDYRQNVGSVGKILGAPLRSRSAPASDQHLSRSLKRSRMSAVPGRHIEYRPSGSQAVLQTAW